MDEPYPSLTMGVCGKLYRITTQIKLLAIREATLGYLAFNFVLNAAEGARALHMLGQYHATVLHSKAQTHLFKQGMIKYKVSVPSSLFFANLGHSSLSAVSAGIVGRLKVTFLSQWQASF